MFLSARPRLCQCDRCDASDKFCLRDGGVSTPGVARRTVSAGHAAAVLSRARHRRAPTPPETARGSDDPAPYRRANAGATRWVAHWVRRMRDRGVALYGAIVHDGARATRPVAPTCRAYSRVPCAGAQREQPPAPVVGAAREPPLHRRVVSVTRTWWWAATCIGSFQGTAPLCPYPTRKRAWCARTCIRRHPADATRTLSPRNVGATRWVGRWEPGTRSAGALN